jgi:hypothetical protein
MHWRDEKLVGRLSRGNSRKRTLARCRCKMRINLLEDHINNQRYATFYAHLLIATHSTCFGRHSPIIRSSGTVFAAYGTVMLICVMRGSTVLSMGLWLMSYNIMWMFIGCGLRDLIPLVGSLSVLVTHNQ